MIDRYVYGKAENVSFEAPVPVIEVEKTESKLGGAGTVMEIASSLGAKVFAVGVAGKDDNQSWIENYLKKLKVDISSFVFDKSLKTMVRTRVIANNHHVARFDESPIVLNKSTTDVIIKNLKKIIPKVNAIVICDYQKGTITKSMIEAIREIATKYHKSVIISSANTDMKYAHPSFIYRITIKHALDLLRIPHDNDHSTEEICQKLESIIKCKRIILTRGEWGLSAYENKQCVDMNATNHKSRDVSSVGDILIGSFAAAHASGLPFVKSCTIGNVAAGMSVEKIGAKRLDLDELQKELDHYDEYEFQK